LSENIKLDYDRYREILNKMAGKYIKTLSEHSLYGKIEFFREYMVKVSIHESNECHGYVKIHYKPSETLFKTSFDELYDEDLEKRFRSLWDKTYRKHESSKTKRAKIDWLSSTPS
jgi:hypothetical protein